MVALVVLTMTAGAADVISFLSLGQVFTALQTGNLIFLALALGGSGATPAWSPAFVTGRLRRRCDPRCRRLSRGAEPPHASGVDSPTGRRHSITIGFLFLGGLLGAFMTSWGTGPALLTLAVAVLGSAIVLRLSLARGSGGPGQRGRPSLRCGG
ncbi:DUF1275 family protein [Actinomycetospora sp. NBRC 106375]|uniref:DUF1275 family protein n=1 Tax=Actinomycetospora sp. NBRC 106375 TaxID=3032207 RepID=UPI003330B33D